MKKQIFAVLLVLLLMLGGCANQTADPTGKIGSVALSEKGEKIADAESTSSPLSSESKSPDAPVETKAPESSVPAKATAALPQKADNQTETPKPTIAPTAPSEGKAPVSESKSAVSKPAAPEKPQETPKPTEKPQEIATPSEPPQQAPEPSEKPSEAPTPTEPPAPSFDVGSYVGYAQSYGQSIGLSLDSTATACWDNPIPASAKSLYIERDLSDLLDWYQASGMTAFWVWAEDLGGGSYNIYVGYA